MGTRKLWGEIDEPDTCMSPDISEDIERARCPSCLDEMNGEDSPTSERSSSMVLQPADPLILYVITLHKYYNDISDMVQTAEVLRELQQDTVALSNYLPPMPPIPDEIKVHTKNHTFNPKTLTPFAAESETNIPELSGFVAKQILSKSIALLLAHAGFEITHQSNLDLLTDVVEEFFNKIGCQLHRAAEDEKNNSFDFPNLIEKVLVDSGMGGIAGLHDYYQTRVVKYVFTQRKRCKELVEYYKTLILPNNQFQPSTSTMEEVISIKIKKEEFDDPNVIHLANVDDHGFSSLATGFQLLNSLEATSAAADMSDLPE